MVTRVRVGVELRWQSLRAMVQIQDSRAMGAVAPESNPGASTGVHQGWIGLGEDDTWLRIGRQEIDFGSSRFVGSLNWHPAARSFDAIRARVRHHAFELDTFAAIVATPRRLQRPSASDAAPSWRDSEGDWLGGLLFGWVGEPQLHLQTYFLFRHDGPTDAREPGPDAADPLERKRDVLLWSVRGAGVIEGALRYELEAVMEMGSVRNEPLLAAGGIAEITWLVGAPWALELGAGASFGSSGRSGELDNFYPSNHLVYGLADLIGLRNQIHGFVRAAASPVPRVLSGWIGGRVLGLYDPSRRWTHAPGAFVGANAANRDALLGFEIDVELRWVAMDPLIVAGGYSLFLPSAGAAQLGHPAPLHFAYVSIDVVL